MGCLVVNKHKHPFDVYIGRGSRWGNPFVIGKDGDRATVIAKYRALLWHRIKSNEITPADLRALDGKTLGCFCKPKACHGDVIAAAVLWANKQGA